MNSILCASVTLPVPILPKTKHPSGQENEQSAIPDSTTSVDKERVDFRSGQDVLLKHKDGRYYLGTVVEVDTVRERCLVKFGDNTQSWSGTQDLTKLSAPEQNDSLCVICKKSAPKDSQEITVCDYCGRGYHQRCHEPEIPADFRKDESMWMCRRCFENEPHWQNIHLRRETIKRICSNTSNKPPPSIPRTLPYQLELLIWDTYHRVNMEQIYCYCGRNGEWYAQMLQCGRCKQWFHSQCLRCLQYPLYCGDRFYVFVCALCNHGKEFLRRLELKWVDLVHLMLFNLTAFNAKKYYDLDTVIIPYINDNWHALQLPPKIANISRAERRLNILSVLTNNRNRFKCGREVKKRINVWGLRVRLPPPAPCVTLPTEGVVCEEQLRQRWQGNRRLQFLASHPFNALGKMIVPTDSHMLNLMMGTVYQEFNAYSDTDSPCPSPDLHLLELSLDDSPKGFKSEFLGGGCAKKSAPFPNISPQRRKRILEMNNRDKSHKKQKKTVTSGEERTNKRCSDYHTKRSSMEVRSSRNSEPLSLTPPTSVSAPPTPPASSTSNSGTDLGVDFPEHTHNSNDFKGSRMNIVCQLRNIQFSELNTPCDTSGDETSSKSTLDLIIPPPKDFKGKNNPFLGLLKGNNEEQGKKRRSKDSITLPLPLTAVIPGRPPVRPMKRQLSEKDICIGPNGEVKRRRLRRGRVNLGNNFGTGGTASKTAAVVPVRPDAKEWGQRNQNSSDPQIGNCFDYTLNVRRLRQRRDKSPEKEKCPIPPAPRPSPVKQEPEIDMDDLKSSVNIYFGAANRIAAGERFTIKAKRVAPTGKLQYLIEWDGPSNGMT